MRKLKGRIRDERGFNLLELMIVIAIIGLLVGVGTIGYQMAIQSGNETTAIQQISLIRTYQAKYAAANRGNFATFEELIQKERLDEKYKGERPLINGYNFTLTVQVASGSTPAFYAIAADPQVPDGVMASGTRHFYFDSSISTIKSTDENRPAKPDDPSI